MSQDATTTATTPTPPQPAPQPAARPQGAPQAAGGPPVQRQMVNFAFYKLDPAFRRLSDHDKLQARSEFLKVVSQRRDGLIALTYSTVGLRPDCDFLLWRIASTTDAFQEQTKAINKTRLGGYLTTPWSFVSMTKRSMYVDKLDPFHTPESRTHIIPGKRKYLFVYPFVKTRDWFLLPKEERDRIMRGHILKGHEYPSVKLNTIYSFGLDDQEWVVAFESNRPDDFLDLVMELRETESSKFTLRDTPIFTCVQMPIENVLDQLF